MNQSIPTDCAIQLSNLQSDRDLDQSEREAAWVVTRFRQALDWMITHPDWEGAMALAISDLGLKGRRQGISFRQAALSLSLEEKGDAIRHMLKSGNLDRPNRIDAKKLARLWQDSSSIANVGRIRLSQLEWISFKRRMSIRVSTMYASYKNAQTSLFLSRSHLAAEVARAICRDRSKLDDAIQEGHVALLNAIDKIEIDKAFDSYARQWIKRCIQNFVMREKLPVKAPINLISQTLRGQYDESEEKTSKAAALLASMSQSTIPIHGGSIGDAESLLELSSDPADSPDQLAADNDDREIIQKALEALTEKQRNVLSLRFGLQGNRGKASLAEIAEMTGISRQQVFQREKRALMKLAKCLAGFREERFDTRLASLSV